MLKDRHAGRVPAGAVAAWIGVIALCLAVGAAVAAPDEDKLGKAAGYPVGTARTWYFDESVRVGSFTHQAEIPGLYRGKVSALAPSPEPMPLRAAARPPDYRWSVGEERDLTVGDFLARQRVTGLLVIKDGVIQVERYQYDRKPTDRFTSQSMGKSITSLAVGFALAEGKIASLDDRADKYLPKLRGSLIGETTLRNLLRMASGARYAEHYDGTGDNERFNAAVSRDGIEAALPMIVDRETAQGARFNYAGAQSLALAAVVHRATGTTLAPYLTPRLWQAIGAEHSAQWITDRTGLELGHGFFNATLRDYGRLGVVLANDGARPDGAQVIPRDYLIEATDWKRQPAAFQPGKASPVLGYGYQFWLYPGSPRRFAMLGVFGQSIFVDPALKLVVVQTGVNATPSASDTSLSRERYALWRGILRHYANR